MTQVIKKMYSVAEYFALEEQAETRNEYLNGEIIPLAGAEFNHQQIVVNLTLELGTQFKRKACWVFPLDMKIQVKVGKDYTYPDIAAVCGNLQFMPGRNDAITNPSLIMEILSKSTGNYDKTTKFERYKSVESLAEYVLINQNKIEVICYRKQPDNSWQPEELSSPQALIKLSSVNAELVVADIYDKVVFS
jgi:Uma2 family endonuclease